MAKRRKKKSRSVSQPKVSSSGWQPSYWMIVALIAIFFAGGVMVKAILSPAPRISAGVPDIQYASGKSSALESQVRLVAANFRCACGGCGELFLVDCTCDMPRGAKEEKDYIRKNLMQGRNIDEVIVRVEQEYGHRI
jgi:hypothetical protein